VRHARIDGQAARDEVANRVAYQAVQLHGGYGYMREFPVERFFRDVRLWTIASGTSEVMREIIAKAVFSTDKEIQ
jgi:alkylation response protein AidB-like acyl-CoA dehydrogenase